jgi:hypothetical protein
MVQVDGTEILTYGAPWGDRAQVALAQDENGCTLTVCVPGYGEMVVSAGGELTGYETLDHNKIWEHSREDYGERKQFFWHLAELLSDTLSWARELCPLLPEVNLEDWRETDYGWRAERDGVMLRIDHDGLVVVADDPFGE